MVGRRTRTGVRRDAVRTAHLEGAARCCSPAGVRSSTASARPIALITVVLAIGSLTLASRVTERSVVRRLDRPALRVRGRLDRLADEFGAGRGSIVALFRGRRRRRRPVRGLPGRRSRVPRTGSPPIRSPTASSAAPRPATTASSAPTATPPMRSSGSTITDEAVGQRDARDPRADRPAGRRHAPARRRRPVHRGPGPPVREGARPGRDDLGPVRRS